MNWSFRNRKVWIALIAGVASRALIPVAEAQVLEKAWHVRALLEGRVRIAGFAAELGLDLPARQALEAAVKSGSPEEVEAVLSLGPVRPALRQTPGGPGRAAERAPVACRCCRRASSSTASC